ncbi:hypothetical protein F4823DRAFT_459934 [Ustulina deusta]|nr:hypothetical protein F4823DRAFT_459934 [Ustulina deusta]
MDAARTPNATSETQALPHETCDGDTHCDGPPLAQTDDISTRDKLIIGSVLGGTAVVVAACLFVLRWRRRRGVVRRRDEKRRDKGKGREEDGDGDGCGRRAPPPGFSARSRDDDDEITIRPERSISWGDP